MGNKLTVPPPQDLIHRVRGQAVILDADLAALYGVTTKRLNEQIRRNRQRFPEDFAFQLSEQEWNALRSQFATSNERGGRRYRPYAFTEHGAIMAANVLNSERAVQMSVAVVRAFIKLRRMALSVEALARKVNQLENKYDERFRFVFDAIRELMTPPDPPRRRIGFSKDAD
jgi:phage regulator Rha-like protein